MAEVRQPVVAIVGHIDHGKTSLLDYIRTSTVAAKEAGGITQRVSAYEVVHKTPDGQTHHISFIDTPGHEAFQSMRRRSAGAADIAILIVASDDGVKPQTIEAIKAITDANVPFIVAFTKIDKNTANLEKAKESVLLQGVYLEGLGGDVPWVALSSKTGEGVPELLDMILLVTDVQNIRSNPDAPVEAVIIETARDPRNGISATVIIKQGTIKVGGFAVSGAAMAPLRALENFAGEKVESLTSGKPARISGFTIEPVIGSLLTTVATKKEAETLVAAAERELKKPVPNRTEDSGERGTFRVVLKADTAGSIEALQYELAKIQHPDVEIIIAGTGVGTINENDIKLVIGFNPAAILGFNVKVDGSAKDLAERQHILLETRTIIYELTEWLTEEVAKHAPDRSGEAITGTAKIIKLFSTAGSKHVLGAKVETGQIKMGEQVTIFRRGIEVGMGKITNLQLQRSNVSTVGEGLECGMQIDSKADIVGGDTIQAGGKKHDR